MWAMWSDRFSFSSVRSRRAFGGGTHGRRMAEAARAAAYQGTLKMTKSRFFAATAVAIISSFALASIAQAACTRLAFSVNDYGKEGPARDARNLLDKYIAKWTADRGIKQYTVGKKDTTCELFIDLIVFDEFTCKAAATVCWNGPMPAGHTTEAGAAPPTLNKAAQNPRPRPAGEAAGGSGAAPLATGSVRPAPASAAPRQPAAAPAAVPAVPNAAAPPAPASN